MAHITLKTLHTEGRLSLGDTLTHCERGDFELVHVYADGSLQVKNAAGEYAVWTLDLPADCRIVNVPPKTKES